MVSDTATAAADCDFGALEGGTKNALAQAYNNLMYFLNLYLFSYHLIIIRLSGQTRTIAGATLISLWLISLEKLRTLFSH